MTDDSAEWWRDAVVYQIYPRSFLDSDGDGIGDLEGVRRKLPYLRETLGVDAVWLSPFYRSPMVDFGYDVADHTDVDPIFGDLSAFDAMLAEAHDLGLRVIVDFVPNHTSDHHPWFVESRASRSSAKRDWYFWRDGRPSGDPPNNWLSMWGGSGWEFDAATGQYYYHHFAKEQPDLNWRNPAVEAAMHDVLRFWLDRGVDGFRIDVADLIAKDPELRDNPPNTADSQALHKSFGAYETQRHVHDGRHPDVHGFHRRLRAVLDEYQPPRVSIGEIHVFDWHQWAAHFGAELDELHLPFNFGLLKVDWSASAVRALVEAIEDAVPEGGWPNYVLGNHDEPRLASRLGEAQARTAAVLLLTLRGTPTLYYGDELGMLDGVIPDELIRDPQAVDLPQHGRDPCRTPMRWSRGPHAGFSPEGATPWLPAGEDAHERNVERCLADRRSLLNLYRELLGLRRTQVALRRGRYRSLEAPEGVFRFERTDGPSAFEVALNFTDRSILLPELGGRPRLSTHDHQPGRLQPHEGVVIAREL